MIINELIEAIRLGNLPLLQTILQGLNLNDSIRCIMADNYLLFRMAALYGHTQIMQSLEESFVGSVQGMIFANDFEAYCIAAEQGHASVLEYLEQQAPNLVPKMQKIHQYLPFRCAAKNGHVEVLQYFKKSAPLLFGKMLRALNYDAYRQAAAHGKLAILRYLEAVAPHMVEKMVRSGDFDAYRTALENQHHEVRKHLITYPECKDFVFKNALELNGHPNSLASNRLTMELLKQEFFDFVRSYFSKIISDANRTQLKKALDAFIATNQITNATESLKVLNIPKDIQAVFVSQMEEKYEGQFTCRHEYREYIYKQFKLRELNGVPIDYTHAWKFEGEVGLMSMLNPQLARASQIGMFAGREAFENDFINSIVNPVDLSLNESNLNKTQLGGGDPG